MHYFDIRWRPSGGRGEYEFVSSESLVGRQIIVHIPDLKCTIPAEVTAEHRHGKPRLRKHDPNNRNKLHLVPLVMALARLPDPAREDKGTDVFPLENKRFVVSQMRFSIESLDKSKVVAQPISLVILHSPSKIDLRKRFKKLRSDHDSSADFPDDIRDSLNEVGAVISSGINDIVLRKKADHLIGLIAQHYGKTNSTTLGEIESLPQSEFESSTVTAKEGKVLLRQHSVRERNQALARKAKQRYKHANGHLACEVCTFDFNKFYGATISGDFAEAHHKQPLETLLPDTETRIEDLAIVCANCHRMLHRGTKLLAVEELRAILRDREKIS
jgi:hypothetical protein